MKRKTIVQWIIAIVVAGCILNSFSFIYYHQAGWINRYDSATYAIWNPNSFITNFYEGYGIAKVDKNGYINIPNKVLANNDYILVMGSSHTQGEQLFVDQKFSTILNNYLVGEDNDKLLVYNIAQDGNFYPDIIRCFNSAIQEFPNSKYIIIEIDSTDFNVKQLLNSLNQDEFNVKFTGINIYENISLLTRIKVWTKELIPLLNLYRQKQFANLKIDFSDAFIYNSTKVKAVDERTDMHEYEMAIDNTLSLIKSEYSGEIIILYHPTVSISENGMLNIDRDETSTVFQSCCEKNNVYFCDTGVEFLEAFIDDHIIPYGFSNTSLAVGHLNKYGHSIIAEELYKIIKAYESGSIGGDKK